MIAAVGMDSGKVYASGTSKADCLRQLHKKYPTFKEREIEIGRPDTGRAKVLPEPMRLIFGGEMKNGNRTSSSHLYKPDRLSTGYAGNALGF